MDADLVQSFKDIQAENSHWEHSPIIDHGGVSVDLCQVIGDAGTAPHGVPDQPKWPPPFSRYRLDIKKYCGIDAAPAVKEFFASICTGCKLFTQIEGKERKKGYLSWQWRCGRYRVTDSGKNQTATFSDGKFSKDGVNEVHHVQERGKKEEHTAFARMGNKKLKANKSPQKRKRVSDRRGDKVVTDKSTKPPAAKKRTLSSSAPSAKQRCHMNVQVEMCKQDGSWYFNSGSNFTHSYHGEEHVHSTTLNESDLNEEQSNYMQLMYDAGVPDQTIASIMSNVLNNGGKPGEFLASTVKNINEKVKRAMDLISGIETDFSVAEKTIAVLKE